MGMPNTIDSTRRLRWDSDDGFFAITPGVVSSFVAAQDDDFGDPDLDEDLDESDDEEWDDEESEEELEDEDRDNDEL